MTLRVGPAVTTLPRLRPDVRLAAARAVGRHLAAKALAAEALRRGLALDFDDAHELFTLALVVYDEHVSGAGKDSK